MLLQKHFSDNNCFFSTYSSLHSAFELTILTEIEQVDALDEYSQRLSMEQILGIGIVEQQITKLKISVNDFIIR